MAEAMTERRQHLHDEREVPDGYELVVAPNRMWRLGEGRRCRFTVGPGYRNCQQPAVAEINRSSTASRQRWWGYCGDHLYGNWIEDGKVMHWILREKRADG